MQHSSASLLSPPTPAASIHALVSSPYFAHHHLNGLVLANPLSTTPTPSTSATATIEPELKRRYLSLLPPTQIIEICLAFEAHAPIHVKNTLWPVDFNLAIAGLQQLRQHQSKLEAETQAPPSITTAALAHDGAAANISENAAPIMGSLMDTSKGQEPPPPAPAPDDPPSDSEPKSDGDTPQTSPVDAADAEVSAAGPSHPTASPASYASSYPMLAQSHYPYTHAAAAAAAAASTATAAYPHAPYYSVPPGAYYHYPSGYYPYHSSATTTTTPAQPPLPPPPPSSSQSLQPTAPQINPQPSIPSSFYSSQHPNSIDPAFGSTHQNNNGTSPDDLPSYEEMIVEALTNCDEGNEGCAPKNLFTWMAAHYPLQTNFRPSASQALQKAFKRGRLLKSTSGKYSLNGAWEGGATTRRTTRRPQMGGPTTLSGPSHSSPPPARASPFTSAPLAHSSLNIASPFGHAASSSSSTTTTTGDDSHMHIAEGSDAWEAAQTILRAINFKGMLTMPAEDDETKDVTLVDPAVSQTPIVTMPSVERGADPMAGQDSEPVVTEARVRLRDALTLLAGQLAAVMEEPDEDEGAAAAAAAGGEEQAAQQAVTPDDSSSCEEEMEEIAVL